MDIQVLSDKKNRRRERLRNIDWVAEKPMPTCNSESVSFEFGIKLLHRNIVGILKQLT